MWLNKETTPTLIFKHLLTHKWNPSRYYYSRTVNLGVMAMEGYSVLPKAIELEPDHWIQFSVLPRTCWWEKCGQTSRTQNKYNQKKSFIFLFFHSKIYSMFKNVTLNKLCASIQLHITFHIWIHIHILTLWVLLCMQVTPSVFQCVYPFIPEVRSEEWRHWWYFVSLFLSDHDL